jgi:hypothetical protein
MDRTAFSREEYPFQLTETDVQIPSDDEMSIAQEINSFSRSACGHLKFNRYSQSNLSTVNESKALEENYTTNKQIGKMNLDKYARYDYSML